MNTQNRKPTVVTLGGGHGHAQLLAALRELDVTPLAIVPVTDDGGCSGQWRTRGLIPMGDMRRCISALARHREAAQKLELRYLDGDGVQRSTGNRVLADMMLLGLDAQSASDKLMQWLEAKGRVLPAALDAGTLCARTSAGTELQGEGLVSGAAASVRELWVEGAQCVNPAVCEALQAADVVMIAPGSFLTSVMAVLSTQTIASVIRRSKAPLFRVRNLGERDREALPLASERAWLKDRLGASVLERLHEVDADALSGTLRNFERHPATFLRHVVKRQLERVSSCTSETTGDSPSPGRL